ncbi:type I secretion system permease/ATPase [Methylotenera sp.]|uniref:type I secretion system permease/ATPase n=2 Tax=Methylotenera sp. TaxID=2051956 RepID=UPI0027307C87|nr:type I secretion system permease/ATPase [Methylotenera sp.]MDP1522596.1 type I secretion system permease/ATPase [Methylotenera sp.]MDP2230179.1 type I secretion system permease/ATPase [Methylotenera sp.]MDP3142104.1 type I secretion system permease/ATPase [Methylotenera sp.]
MSAEGLTQLGIAGIGNAGVVDSLLDSLLLICRIQGVATSRDALISGLPLRDGRMTPALLKRSAERVNLAVTVLKKPLEKIRSEFLPAILLLKDEEACVVTKLDFSANQAHVIFPELGEAEISIAINELELRYSGYYIVAKAKFSFDQRAPIVGKVRLRHWFWGTLAENSRIYRDIMVAAFVVNMFALAMPLFTMNVYDRVVPNRAVETLWVMAIGISLIIIGDLILRTLRSYFLDWASTRVDVKLTARIMEQVLGIRLEQRPNSVGSFASNLRSFETVRDFITSATITTLIDIPFGLIFVVVMAWIAWPMAIPVIIGAILILVYSFSVQTKMHELSETMYRASAIRNATLIESLVGLETVKALGIEGQMQRKWEHSAHFLTEVSSKLRLLSSSINNGASSIQQLINITLVVLGVYLVVNGDLTMGGLIACTMLASRALVPIAQTAGLLTQYHNAATALTSLDEIMHRDVERPLDAKFLSRPAFSGNIEFREVSFSYPGTEQDALTKVSFKIKAGEHVALLGRMGSGKSTIHKLILGLYQPTSGAILIDGIDARQIDPAELRRCVGYVQQDTHLFYGTMRENLTISAQHVDDDAVLAAAHVGGIDEFVNSHPKGFDMLIGERGETLSGGQRQGVGIARALIGNPSILLLDEPTSAMDHSGEDAIKRRLLASTKHKTLVLISHRSSLYDLVDRIIVIDSGRIVADGPKDQVTEALRSGKVGKAL